MPSFSRRWGVFVRPFLFVPGGLAFVYGIFMALAWDWEMERQTGNIFISIKVPFQMFVWDLAHTPFWLVALVGLGLLVFGLSTRSGAEKAAMGGGGLLAPSARFYPLTFLFGIFMTYFGTVFFFNASVTGDELSDGLVGIVYLNYAGIMNRVLVSLVSGPVLLVGLLCLTVFALERGVRVAQRTPPRKPAAAPA